MRSLDILSLFTNIPFEETIEICTNDSLFFKIHFFQGLKKSEFKDIISSATKE